MKALLKLSFSGYCYLFCRQFSQVGKTWDFQHGKRTRFVVYIAVTSCSSTSNSGGCHWLCFKLVLHLRTRNVTHWKKFYITSQPNKSRLNHTVELKRHLLSQQSLCDNRNWSSSWYVFLYAKFHYVLLKRCRSVFAFSWSVWDKLII